MLGLLFFLVLFLNVGKLAEAGGAETYVDAGKRETSLADQWLSYNYKSYSRSIRKVVVTNLCNYVNIALDRASARMVIFGCGWADVTPNTNHLV